MSRVSVQVKFDFYSIQFPCFVRIPSGSGFGLCKFRSDFRFSSDSGHVSVQVRFYFGSVNLSMSGLARVLVSGQQWFRSTVRSGQFEMRVRLRVSVHCSLNF
ncbi:hypothetical protein Hanom_Chr10g00960281 [Helianthus anomalus]